jgi:hypothetical protein
MAWHGGGEISAKGVYIYGHNNPCEKFIHVCTN